MGNWVARVEGRRSGFIFLSCMRLEFSWMVQTIWRISVEPR
jgi:hypothetical protein